MTMDQTQLELDLQIAEEKKHDGASEKSSAQVVSLQFVREEKRQRKIATVYQAILASVEHIGMTEQRYK
jgi:hypothetical protein